MGLSKSKLNENTSLYFCTENDNKVVFSQQVNELVISVDRQKLLEKSAYFRTFSKPCYKHHNSVGRTKVLFPAKSEIVEDVMQFINSDLIKLDVKNLLETSHLAEFLQIDCLQQLCFDHFTYNLNQISLKSQLGLMTEQYILDRKFEERALMFSKSGKPSFSGLYFVQQRSPALKMFGKRSKSFYEISKFRNKTFTSLHYVDHMLCSIVQDRDNEDVILFQYDLLSGKMYNVILENVKMLYYKNVNYKSTICTDSKNLFIISEIDKDKNECSLSLSVFHRKSLTGCLEKRLNLTIPT